MHRALPFKTRLGETITTSGQFTLTEPTSSWDDGCASRVHDLPVSREVGVGRDGLAIAHTARNVRRLQVTRRRNGGMLAFCLRRGGSGPRCTHSHLKEQPTHQVTPSWDAGVPRSIRKRVPRPLSKAQCSAWGGVVTGMNSEQGSMYVSCKADWLRSHSKDVLTRS